MNKLPDYRLVRASYGKVLDGSFDHGVWNQEDQLRNVGDQKEDEEQGKDKDPDRSSHFL